MSKEVSNIVIKEGLATSWLERLHEYNEEEFITQNTSEKFPGIPRVHIPLYIRTSHFKLPNDISLPVIMVGPGTGVAPFRGFIRERLLMARNGSKVGPTVLFFGCRNKNKVPNTFLILGFDIRRRI